MANQGIYREPGAAGGLPLPRTRMTLLTIVVGVLALVAMALPPCLLAVAGHSMAGAWRLFQNGGGSMWLLLLLDFVIPIAIAVLGAFVLRGRSVPAGLLFVAASFPFGVALLGAWWGQHRTMGAVAGEAIDPEMRSRILAEGVAETMSTDIFGGLVVCGVAIVAAAAAASAVATIDVAALSRGGPKPPSGVLGAAVAGGVWLLATIVMGGVRLRAAGAIGLVPTLAVIVLVVFAVLAARGSGVLRTWHDRAEASRTAGALLVAGLCGLLALLALQRGIESTSAARALSAISGESLDPSQRMRVLAEAVDAGRLGGVSFAIHAVLGTATFGLALLPALGNGRHPVTASSGIAAAFGAALLLSAFALGHARTAIPRTMLAQRDAAVANLTLPVVVNTLSDKSSGRRSGTLIDVAKDGTGTGDLSKLRSCDEAQQATVYADAAATLAMVGARLPGVEVCTTHITLVAKRNHPPEMDKLLGDYAGYLGTTAYFELSRGPEGSGFKGGSMQVISIVDDAIQINGTRVALPIAPGASAVSAPGPQFHHIRYTFHSNDTVDHLISVMVAVEKLEENQLASYGVERELVIDDGIVRTLPTLPEGGLSSLGGGSTGPTPSLRQGATQVNGRLPPEVIQRIVRQNFGRFRLCYENGLRKNPDLQGRITVRFVIDRTGAATSAADGGSDLPDKDVIACVVRGFGNLSFPQPEGGIVTVLYPINFSPGS